MNSSSNSSESFDPSDAGPQDASGDAESIDKSRQRSLRAAVLTHGDDRARAYERHPLVTNNLRLPTPAVKESYAEIERAIIHREPGTCFVTQFRVGKTTGIAVIVATLKEAFKNDFAVGCVIAKYHKSSSEYTFYSDILESFKHLGTRTKSSTLLRKRVLETVRNQARRAKTDRYLLVIDEGQNWSEDEWTFLRDLTNDWINDGLSIIPVVFAHPKLEEVIQQLKVNQRTDLIGRFLLSLRAFKGVSSLEDFTAIARLYDDAAVAEYPPQSGISVSEFFMPNAWRGGWRFEQEINPMFDAFSALTNPGTDLTLNIGMNWVTAAVRNFFFSQTTIEHVGFQSSAEVWADAVAGSGYEASFFRED